MKIVVCGLGISSSWGNGHATHWRALARALKRRGHRLVFFERIVPYYAQNRDDPGGSATLVLYRHWLEVQRMVAREWADADLGLVTSYCPDALAASDVMLESRAGLRAFYDLDAPVTLDLHSRGQPVAYLGERALRDFDLVLSFTGGLAPELLKAQLGARHVRVLHACVDADLHRPIRVHAGARSWALTYLGTYAPDRQEALEELLISVARRLPRERFAIAGAQFPRMPRLPANVELLGHVPAAKHAEVFARSRLTLNITRSAMARLGACPSSRLFEAAACNVPILSDTWQDIETFLSPASEFIPVSRTDDVLQALSRDDAALGDIARAARLRVLAEHTADRRVLEFEDIIRSETQRVRSGIELEGRSCGA